MKTPHLFIAIPAMDELEFLPRTLQAIENQMTDTPFTVYVCVNQPDAWWELPDKRELCVRNQQLFSLLREYKRLSLCLLDYTSPGKGWKGKNHGVGWARKVLFDTILSVAGPEDIIVSLDADTLFGSRYIQSIADNFKDHPDYAVISMPYYHPLTSDDEANRAILRYELYMRSFFLNMHRIGSPYTFTAIGSAIAMKAWALDKIGGITPSKSGEDFYLLQKLRKMVPINNWNAEIVNPAARFSDRVFFGTGPAMIKGAKGDWESYPIYHHALFEKIKQAYDLIPSLFKHDVENEFLLFLEEQFKDNNLWTPLRNNYKELFRFERAFHEKADGLRILQFMKQEKEKHAFSDEEALLENMSLFFPQEIPSFLRKNFSMETLRIEQLNTIRDMLFQLEFGKRAAMLYPQPYEYR